LWALRSDSTGLSKPLRAALEFLATNEEIGVLAASLQEQLVQADPNSDPDPQSGFDSLLETLDIDVEWSEGVEDLRDLSTDDLWALLGLPEKAVPFFNARQDPFSANDPWTKEGRQWLDDNGKPLELRPHQLVGVVKMIINFFAGKPVLLMDGVGLGKTIQFTASIAILAYYRDYYTTHKSFPGAFGALPFLSFIHFTWLPDVIVITSAGKEWRSGVPNIPALPVVLVVPVNLVDQIVHEFHRYLQHGSFDVLPYLTSWNSRPLWWEHIWGLRSNQPQERRIVVTTPTVSLLPFLTLFAER